MNRFLKNSLSTLLLLTLTSTALIAVELKVKDVKGKPAEFIAVYAETTGKTVRWVALDNGLNVFPGGLLKNEKATVVSASSPGKYRLLSYTAEGDNPSDPVISVVEIEGLVPPGPVPPTPPGPTPPGPTPPVPPAPIPVAGLRVLIVYDSSKETELTAAQQAILHGVKMNDYLVKNCATGPDGKTKEYRIWPASTVLADVEPHWKQAMERKRESLPWLLVSDGKTGYEGPLPVSVEATIAIIDKVITPPKK